MSLRVLTTEAHKLRSEFGPSKPLDLLCDWTRDPDVCYAFESRAGAQWWQRHGGPPGLCAVLEARGKRPRVPSVPDAKVVSPMCFACNTPLCQTLRDDVECLVIKCGCRSRVIHTRCKDTFEGTECVYCDQQYSMCVHNGQLTVPGRIRGFHGSSDK